MPKLARLKKFRGGSDSSDGSSNKSDGLWTFVSIGFVLLVIMIIIFSLGI